MITKPTKISKKQYKKAFFADNPETYDSFLVMEDGTSLWVGRDKDSTENSNPASNPDCYEKEVCVTDENGMDQWINAWCCPTSEAWNDLDLDALAEGRVEWM